MEALFMEGAKYVLSNYLIKEHHNQALQYLFNILEGMIVNKYVKEYFAFNLADIISTYLNG
jgi:hypothetical protein